MAFPDMKTEKREFINWFLKKHQLKRRESVWMLNFLMSDIDLLKNVHFVEDAKLCPRGMVISSTESNDAALVYYQEGRTITEAEKIFQDIRTNKTDPLYLQINFDKTKVNVFYIAVLEENPYASKDVTLTESEKQWIDETLHKSQIEFQREQILREIDKALDEKDETRFIELTTLLQPLN